MPWNSNVPDPLESRRRLLEEKQRRVAEQMARLKERLHHADEPIPAEIKAAEPPVWRMEEEGAHSRAANPASARKRNLGRQRQRDMVLFFILIGLLLILLGIVLLVAYVHTAVPTNGA